MADDGDQEAMESDSDSGSSDSGLNDSGARKDNSNDFDFGESYDSAGGAPPAGGKGGGGQVVEDKPYDEAIELGSDDEVSTPGSSEAGDHGPKKAAGAKGGKGGGSPGAARPGGPGSPPGGRSGSDREDRAAAGKGSGGGAQASPKKDGSSSSSGSDSGDSSSDEEDGDGKAGGAGGGAKNSAGAYNPAAYANLRVEPEVQELFQYISRYTPHTIELDTKLKPLIPDLIPAIGEVDAFLKIPQPDGKNSDLGLAQLDEPCLNPSDPSVLDLRLRALSKHVDLQPMEVRSIEDPEKNPKEVKAWVDRIADLHRAKPAATVQYSRRMPDIEQLMQVWPAEFEEYITANGYPNLAELDVSLGEYVKILATILDVPVYDQLTDTLHVIFTLFAEFQQNQHFAPSMENANAPWNQQWGTGGDPYNPAGSWNPGGIPPNSRAPSPSGMKS